MPVGAITGVAIENQAVRLTLDPTTLGTFNLPSGQQLSVRYTDPTPGTDGNTDSTLQGADGADVSDFTANFTYTPLTTPAGAAPTFTTAPTFQSSTGVLTLNATTGSLDTSSSGSPELRNQFSISTAASGGAIAGAITNVTLTGAGIQLNLDSTALSAYNNQNLFINYNDVTGDQTTGILQASSGGADVASFSQSFNYTSTAGAGPGPAPSPSTSNYSGTEFWINFTGQDLNTSGNNFETIKANLAVSTDPGFTNPVPGAISSVVDVNTNILKLNFDKKYAIANSSLNINDGDTLYLNYNPAATDILEATDGTDVAPFSQSFSVDLSGVTAGGAGAPTFSAPTFSSSTGILNLPVATGSLDTAPSGSQELRNQFFISTSAGGMDIAGAITNVTLTGAGVQLTLDSATLSSYNGQTLTLNFGDTPGNQTTGVLQATDGTDVASFTQTFNYSTTAAGGGAAPAFTTAAYESNSDQVRLDFSGQNLKIDGDPNQLKTQFTVFTAADAGGTQMPVGAITGVAIENQAVRLTLDPTTLGTFNLPSGQQLSVRYTDPTPGTDGNTDSTLQGADGADVSDFTANFTYTPLTTPAGAAPTFTTAPTFQSSTGVLTLNATTGSLDTSSSGSPELRNQFSISTAASGGAIAGAITNVTLTGAGIQLNLDSTALSAYNNQNLFINYNDVTGDQTTGILQASSGGADVASFSQSFNYTSTAGAGPGPAPSPSTSNYSGTEFWINFTGQDLNTSGNNFETIKANLAVYTDPGFTNPVPGAISSVVDVNTNILKLNFDKNAIANSGLNINDGDTLYIRYNPAATDILEATDGTDVAPFSQSFSVDLSGVTAGGAGAPTFSAPTFSSSTGILNLPVATGSLSTAPSGSQELRNQFFISTSAGGMDIAGAITNVTLTGAGVQLTAIPFSHTFLVQRTNSSLLNFGDTPGNQTTGVLQATDGTDIASFTQTFAYSTTTPGGGGPSTQPLAFSYANSRMSDSQSKVWLEFSSSDFTVPGQDTEAGREALKNSFVISANSDFTNPIANAIELIEFNTYNIELTLSDAAFGAYIEGQNNQYFLKFDQPITSSDGTVVPNVNTQFWRAHSYFPTLPANHEEGEQQASPIQASRSTTMTASNPQFRRNQALQNKT